MRSQQRSTSQREGDSRPPAFSEPVLPPQPEEGGEGGGKGKKADEQMAGNTSLMTTRALAHSRSAFWGAAMPRRDRAPPQRHGTQR